MVRERLTPAQLKDSFMTPSKMVLFCCLTWLISFSIMSPTIFEVETPQNFGHFGYSKIGCSIVGYSGLPPTTYIDAAIVLLIGLCITISYTTLYCFLKQRTKQTSKALGKHFKTVKLNL